VVGLVELMGFFQRSVDPTSRLLLQQGYGDWVCVDSHGR
jgi:hypothetical protein